MLGPQQQADKNKKIGIIKLMRIFLFIFFILLINRPIAIASCSRVAIINYQEVLVDAGSEKKGEGLRFYLEKNPQSKSLLDEYQEKSAPSILSASASTVGSLMVLTSILQADENSQFGSKATLFSGGAILIALSYLASKTVKYNNEKLLERSVDIYNKSHSPRIYFSPFGNDNGQSGVGVGIQQKF